MSNHDKFLANLEASKGAVWQVARWLVDTKGFPVTVNPTKQAGKAKDWSSFVDEGDIIATTPQGKLKVEVKHLKGTQFTCATDWPYPRMIVYAVAPWDRMVTKADRIILVNKDSTHAAIVDGGTWQGWEQVNHDHPVYENYNKAYYTTTPTNAKYIKL